jgi:hypothetical protein
MKTRKQEVRPDSAMGSRSMLHEIKSQPYVRSNIYKIQNIKLNSIGKRIRDSTYRVSQEESARLWENVPYVKVHRYNPKNLYPMLNGYGDNGQRKV